MIGLFGVASSNVNAEAAVGLAHPARAWTAFCFSLSKTNGSDQPLWSLVRATTPPDAHPEVSMRLKERVGIIC
jgi:hypothetical protein